MVTIDTYYDFRSPFAYFAAQRIASGKIASPVSLQWRWLPVSIDVLLNLQANRSDWAPYSDQLAAPKRRHFLTDVVRCAEYYSVAIRPPMPWFVRESERQHARRHIKSAQTVGSCRGG